MIASNFQRSFRAKQKATKDYMALPTEVKRLMISAGYRSDPTEVGLVKMFGGGNDVPRLGTPGDYEMS